MFRDSCTWSWICILQLLFVHMIIINCCYGSIRDANMFENCQEKQKILFTSLMVAIVLKKQPNVVVCWSQVQQLLGTHHENKRKPQGFPTEFCNVLCKRNACSFHMAIFNFLALHSIAIISVCAFYFLSSFHPLENRLHYPHRPLHQIHCNVKQNLITGNWQFKSHGKLTRNLSI